MRVLQHIGDLHYKYKGECAKSNVFGLQLQCGIEGCTSEAKKNTQLASIAEIEMVMGQPITSFTVAAEKTYVRSIIMRCTTCCNQEPVMGVG